MMIAKVHGELSDITGTVNFDPSTPESTEFEVTINTATLTTANDQRDGHLKSADFLDVEHYPTITYKSKSVRKVGDEDFEVTGDLTLHGVTRELTLKTEVTPETLSPWGGYKIGVSASGMINREDFGMTWNQALEAGGFLVGKDINLQIDVELDRVDAA